MDLKYDLTDLEIEDIADYSISKMENKPKFLKLIKKNTIRVLCDLREQDISINEDGIYLKDVDMFLSFSKLKEIDSFENIIKISIANYNIYIPLRVFNSEDERDDFFRIINENQIDNIINIKLEEVIDENNFAIRTIMTRTYYDSMKNLENKLYNTNKLKFLNVVLSIVLFLETIPLAVVGISYGVASDQWYKCIARMFVTFVIYCIAVRITFKTAEVRLKRSELKNKFRVDIKVDNENMIIIEDGKEFCYNLKDIVKVEEKDYGLLIYYKFKKKYKQLIIGQNNKSSEAEQLLKNKLIAIAKENESIEKVTKYEKKKKRVGFVLVGISLVFVINMFAVGKAPKMMKKYIPKTYNELTEHRIQYEKQQKEEAMINLMKELNNVFNQISEQNENQ